METKPYYYWRKNVLFLEIHLQPNATKNAIVGRHGDKLKISVTAQPIEDKANQELIKFIAQFLNLPKSQINLVKGKQNRNKLIAVYPPQKNLNTLLAF